MEETPEKEQRLHDCKDDYWTSVMAWYPKCATQMQMKLRLNAMSLAHSAKSVVSSVLAVVPAPASDNGTRLNNGLSWTRVLRKPYGQQGGGMASSSSLLMPFPCQQCQLVKINRRPWVAGHLQFSKRTFRLRRQLIRYKHTLITRMRT